MFDFFNQDRLPGSSTAATIDLWPSSTQQQSAYAWPTGFTPEGDVSSVASYSMDPASIMGPQETSMLLSNTGFSPNTEAAKLMTALESQTAYIHGDPADGKELELFYYRFVSGPFVILLRSLRSLDQRPFSECD
jgi:hypothetical protein